MGLSEARLRADSAALAESAAKPAAKRREAAKRTAILSFRTVAEAEIKARSRRWKAHRRHEVELTWETTVDRALFADKPVSEVTADDVRDSLRAALQEHGAPTVRRDGQHIRAVLDAACAEYDLAHNVACHAKVRRFMGDLQAEIGKSEQHRAAPSHKKVPHLVQWMALPEREA